LPARLRWAAIGAVAVVHLTALLFLGPLGYNYDVVVWPWNLAMLGLVIVLFAMPPEARIRRTFSEFAHRNPAWQVWRSFLLYV
jgi:uncharacterized membrane protein